MGRTQRKRKKRQLLGKCINFYKVINLQRSLRIKSPNVQVDYFSDVGWGMRCKKRISEGDIILALPLNHLITVDVHSEIFSVIRRENEEHHFILCIFLMYELHLKNDSKYYEYISSLPKSFTNLYFCTEDEFKLLPDFMKHELRLQIFSIEKSFNELLNLISYKSCPHCGKTLKTMYSKKNFIWAWFIVNTRSVFYKDRKHDKSLALAPFLDLFNHSDGATIEMSIDFEKRLYILKTLNSYKKFEQVYIKYGAHSNFKLILEYGFILSDNPNDYVEFSFHETLDTIKEFNPSWGKINKSKYNFIKSNKLNQYLTKNSEFSCNFSGLISVLISQDKDLFSVLQSKVYSNILTSSEKDLIKKIRETVSQKKYKELQNYLAKMESINKCTVSFQLVKKIIKNYMNFLK